MSNRTPWTERQLRLLRELYPDMLAETVAREIGRPVSSVHRKAAEFGLRKSEAFYARDLSGRIQRGRQHPSMVAAQFQPGLVPWNKGPKGIAGTHPNSRATQFRKGSMSGAAQHNYVPIGSLKIVGGVLAQKVTDDPALYPARRWVTVHRMVWEAAYGPVPAGHAVVFKPGKKTHELERITVDILELLTRAELMKRNSLHTNYPPEVAQLILLRGTLNRQINARTRAMEQA